MKKILLGTIIGIILCGGIVYAVNYNATDITYSSDKTSVENVNDALDELYNKLDTIKVRHLGSLNGNGTIDCTSIPNYQNLTVDDFIVAYKSVSTSSYIYMNPSGGLGTVYGSVSKSYNASTGVLTVNGLTLSFSPANANHGAGGSGKVVADIYCIK